MANIKTYSELIKLKTFEERFNYLRIKGTVGKDTFGSLRYINQKFYLSDEWKRLRNDIIIRDNACDLGVEGYDIFEKKKIYIHHINPITVDDIVNQTEFVRNPDFLICCSKLTHDCIHYGVDGYTPHDENKIIERTPFDTSPWRL